MIFSRWLLMASILMASNALAVPPQGVDLTVQVQKVQHTKGQLILTIYKSEDDWLEDGKAIRTLVQKPQKGTSTFVLKGLPSGTYGISCYHDENSNKELDMQWLPPGPTEGAGASNNAEPGMGPPKFSDAKFNLTKTATIKFDLEYP